MKFSKTFRIIIGVIFTVMLAAGFLFAYGLKLFIPIVEVLTNETPKAKISTYLLAVSKGDKEAAFSVWEDPMWSTAEDYRDRVKEQRESATNNLLNKKISSGFKIINTKWLSACCMMGVTDRFWSAGSAIIQAELNTGDKKEIYVFDMLAQEYDIWSSSNEARHWVISDVYLLGSIIENQ